MNMFKVFSIFACVIAAATAFPHATSYVTRHDTVEGGHGGAIGGGYGAGYGGGYGGGEHGGHGAGLDGGYGGHGGYAEHYNHYPKYTYDYGVNDAHTGDNKKAWESRHGDVVKGGYSLKEADGTTRVVEYVADDHNGFNAIVKKIGHAHHPQVYGHAGGYGGGHDGGYGGGYGAGYGSGHGY